MYADIHLFPPFNSTFYLVIVCSLLYSPALLPCTTTGHVEAPRRYLNWFGQVNSRDDGKNDQSSRNRMIAEILLQIWKIRPEDQLKAASNSKLDEHEPQNITNS